MVVRRLLTKRIEKQRPEERKRKFKEIATWVRVSTSCLVAGQLIHIVDYQLEYFSKHCQ